MAGNAIQFNLGFNIAPLTAGAAKAQATVARSMARISSSVKTVATQMKVPVLAAGAALAALGATAAAQTMAIYDLGGALSDLSARTGIAAGDVLVLQQAFKNSGLEAGSVGPAVNKLQRAITSAARDGGAAAQAFDRLGLRIKDLVSLSPAEQFRAVAAAIAAVPNPAERATAAIDLFGKAGAALLPLFSDPNALTGAISELGGQIDVLNQKSAVFDAIGDKIRNMIPAKIQGFFVGLADGLAVPIQAMLDRIEKADLTKIGQDFGKTMTPILNAMNWTMDRWGTIVSIAEKFANAMMPVLAAMKLILKMTGQGEEPAPSVIPPGAATTAVKAAPAALSNKSNNALDALGKLQYPEEFKASAFLGFLPGGGAGGGGSATPGLTRPQGGGMVGFGGFMLAMAKAGQQAAQQLQSFPIANTTRGAFASTRTSLGGAYGQIRRGDAARRRRTEEAARKEAELAKNKTPEGTNERLDKMIKGFGFK